MSESGGDNSIFTADATSGESIGRGVLRFRPDDRWAFEAGGEAAYNFLDSATPLKRTASPSRCPPPRSRSRSCAARSSARPPGGPARTSPSRRACASRSRKSASRATATRRKSFVYPKPRVRRPGRRGPATSSACALEREVGQLDFGDFVASADIDIGQVEGGNPDLEPQQGQRLRGRL